MPAIRVEKKMRSADKTDRRVAKTSTHLRSQAASKMVKLYRTKIKRNRQGKVVSGGVMTRREAEDPSRGRIAPDRRWFGNSRVIDPKTLDAFRKATDEAFHDPYSVIVDAAKLPTALLDHNSAETLKRNRHRFYAAPQAVGTVGTVNAAAAAAAMPIAASSVTDAAAAAAALTVPILPTANVKGTMNFKGTFGAGSTRKRPNLDPSINSYASLAATARDRADRKAAAAIPPTLIGAQSPTLRVDGLHEKKAKAGVIVKLHGGAKKVTAPGARGGISDEAVFDKVMAERLTKDDCAGEDGTVMAPYVKRVDDGRGVGVSVEEARDMKQAQRETVFGAGMSPRIWGELYKVVDSSDVIVQVLDARDPMGTRSRHLETYLRKEKPLKKLIFILNKCDLIPTWATARWVAVLSREYPTVAFRAHVQRPFGKGNTIALLRQLARLKGATRTRALTVGFIGYPNVGKSSVINAIRGSKSCLTAPIPGETKVWQYVNLTRKIFLIDCPGVVHRLDDANDETAAVLKSVVRVEKLGPEDKLLHVQRALQFIPAAALSGHYGIPLPPRPTDAKKAVVPVDELRKQSAIGDASGESAVGIARRLGKTKGGAEAAAEAASGFLEHYPDANRFLTAIAIKRGRLLVGGVPDIDTSARMVLLDWQRGRLPWFIPPPFDTEEQRSAHVAKGDKAHLELLLQSVVRDMGGADLESSSSDDEGDAAEVDEQTAGARAAAAVAKEGAADASTKAKAAPAKPTKAAAAAEESSDDESDDEGDDSAGSSAAGSEGESEEDGSDNESDEDSDSDDDDSDDSDDAPVRGKGKAAPAKKGPAPKKAPPAKVAAAKAAPAKGPQKRPATGGRGGAAPAAKRK